MARREYREEEDTLGHFLKACCILHALASVKASRLYERYKAWTTQTTLKAMNGNAFGLEMKKLFEQKRRNDGRVDYGIGLPEDGLPSAPSQTERLLAPDTPSRTQYCPIAGWLPDATVPSAL